MNTEIQHADLRLRRVTILVLGVAGLAAFALLIGVQHWMTNIAASMPAERLVASLRRWIGFAMTASALCLALLAGYSARVARRARAQQRWPLAEARVLRDTPIRRGEFAMSIGRLLNVAAVILVVLALAAALLGWRLFSAGP
ncbi:MAG: hypothetical protein ACHP7D_05015 [Lysobacterales bacterium]